MLLKDFITDYKRAVATEIYNAQMNSVEDTMSVMDKIEKEASQFLSIISMCENLFINMRQSKHSIARDQERLKKLNELKNSHIGQLIAKFAANNTDECLEAIKKELERSNDFDIHIVLRDARFRVKSTETYYLFDNFDVDADIQRTTSMIGHYENFLKCDMKAKDRLRDACGVEAFDFMVEQFEKNDMIMPNAPCDYNEDYDDDYDDYYDDDEDY